MANKLQAQALLEEIDALIDENITPSQRLKETNALLEALKNSLKEKKEFPEKFDVNVLNSKEYPEEVRVSNLKDIPQTRVEIPKEIKVSNLKDIPKPSVLFPSQIKVSNLKDISLPNFPSEIKVTKPEWIDELKSQPIDLKGIFPKSAKDAIPVRLSDGERFYDLLTQVVASSGGGGGTTPPFINSLGEPKYGIVDDTTGRLKVDAAITVDSVAENIAEWGGVATSLGQKAMTASVPVVIASDQSAIPASQSGTWNITNVSGTVSLPTGASTAALQTTGNTSLSTIAGAVSGSEMQVDVVTMPTVTTNEARASTASVTSVNDTASSTTLLAANSSRLSVRIYNDSTAILYVKFGTTASATDFTVQLNAEDYFEDYQYTGRIDGIWASDASGAAKITELTA